MTLKNIVAAMAAVVALASPLAASAGDYEYNDGTYKWGFNVYGNNDEQYAVVDSVARTDGQKISGALAFPATVTVTVTNELGYSKYDETTEKYNWVQTRAQKIMTLTLPVEAIDWPSFLYEESSEYGKWTMWQPDPLITSITIPEGVKGVYGLVDVCLTNVTAVAFPSTVKLIEDCFGYCDKLASVSVPEDAFIDGAFIGTPWAKAMGDFFVWNRVLIRYQGTATEVVVPEGVAVIATAAFAPYYWEGYTEESSEMFASATNITKVTLPSSLEQIGYNAFDECEKLASVNLPNGVYSIDPYAFWSTALTSVALPRKLRLLDRSVFGYTAISSLVIPAMRELDCTFDSMTNLTSVTIPSTAKSLWMTFNGCSKLTAVDIPASVEEIGDATFGDCKALTSVTGGAGLKNVASNAFGSNEHWDYEKRQWVDGTGVPFCDNAPDGLRVLGPVAYGYKGDLPETLVIPGNVKYVMANLTSGCDKSAIKTITLSDGVETIGSSAFGYCTNLETVNLGNTVTNLGYNAFWQNWRYEYDSNLGYSVYKPGKLATVTGGAALEAGCDAFSYNSKFYEDLAVLADNDDPFALIRLGKVVLSYRGKFTDATFAIPDDVTEFGLWGWGDSQTNVTAVTGGAALTGFVSLYDFYNLQKIDLTGEISGISVPQDTLAEISIPNAKLTWFSFEGCTNLVSATLGLDPDGGIPSSAFLGCDKLQSVNFVCKGCKLTGFEARFNEPVVETFPNDLSTFKFIGQRTDFSPVEPGEWVNWSEFYLIPKVVKVMIDETSLEPFDKDVKGDYAGILYDAEGKFAGTFEVAVKKASKNKDASATVKITPLEGKKETLKGAIDANGNGQGALAGLRFGANGITGTLTAAKSAETFMAEGASDITKSKSKDVKDFLKAFKGKAWGAVFGWSHERESDFANGFIALSVTMNNGGKAKVAGVMPNGTKVSVNAKLVAGTDAFAIPVAFAKSDESFGFVLWVDENGKVKDLTDITDWTGKANKVPFVQSEQVTAAGNALIPAVDPLFMVNASDLPDGLSNALVRFLPICEAFGFKGGDPLKWEFAKAPSIKAKNGVIDEEKLAADVAKGKTNLSDLKLKVNKKTGVVTGSFNIYAFDAKGKLKKNKTTVNGVLVNGIGYGAASVKKIGAVPVLIGQPDSAVEE